jgi:predicted deacetylase
VLHGYWHERVATHELRGAERIIAQSYTAGEGEFFDLSEAHAITNLATGLREMEEALGIKPPGFIAPAWLLGREARRAIQHFTFSYTTLLDGVWDLQESVFYSSQSLCYSVRAPWRRACSLAWNSALLGWLDDSPLVRLGLHPPDWEHGAIRSHALVCAERALVGRPPMTYDSWVHRQRQQTLSNS